MSNSSSSSSDRVVSKFGAKHGGGDYYLRLVGLIVVLCASAVFAFGIYGAHVGTNDALAVAAAETQAVTIVAAASLTFLTVFYIRLRWIMAIAFVILMAVGMYWLFYNTILAALSSSVKPFFQL